ncbi:atrial natriuretic peptide receptor 3-like [Saccostrea cucullata]|uniref:atrial natriuretic peptide receptor 3-like n=1 Tax=Saccostrea cuccullata TaxID=36930 RepID=UPI002ED11BDD
MFICIATISGIRSIGPFPVFYLRSLLNAVEFKMAVKLHLLVSIVLLVLDLVSGRMEEDTQVIKIATIIPRDNRRLFSIQRIRPALEIANEKVREMELLPNHNISVNFADSECSIEVGMKEAIQFYVDREVHLFLGPCCDYAAAPIVRQIKYWNLPMITPGAMASDFARLKNSEFRLMTRVGSSVNSLVLMLMAVLHEYRWSKTKIIYNPNGQDYITNKYCHIVADGVHYGMPSNPEYAKFEKVEEFLDRMTTDIGRENAVDLRRTTLFVETSCLPFSQDG